MACKDCGNDYAECVCRDRAVAIVEGIVNRPSKKLFESFLALHHKFHDSQWGEWFHEAIKNKKGTTDAKPRVRVSAPRKKP